ncbi:MAG TPA: IPT/TIG domain-containing protein [Polyangia bacterium]|nr:IPT/TIG domain-containing protein [Polyangia bacterium]
MRLPASARVGVASLFALTCTSAEAPVGVTGVSPAEAFNDKDVPVVIAGGPFRPAYDIDTTAGSATAQQGAFGGVLSPSSGFGPQYAVDGLTWLSSTELAAVVPSDIVEGVYDLEVRDPRGVAGTLTGGYRSLGPDKTAPALSVLEPTDGAVVVAGADVPVAFQADDDLGRLGLMRWSVLDPTGTPIMGGSCAIDPNAAKATCRFVYTVPLVEHSQIETLSVEARDTAGNRATRTSTVVVALAPVVTSVAPLEGSASGGTPLVVTGDNFVAGTELLLDGTPLSQPGGVYVSPQMLAAKTPTHAAGSVALAVRSGSAVVQAGVFAFVGRPVVLAISPTTGPLAGNIPVVIGGRNFRDGPNGTTIEVGPSDGPRVALGCPEVVNENRITGVLPPGMGAVSIFASDPIGGATETPLAFTYLSDDDADGGETSDGGDAADAAVQGPATCIKTMGSP